MENLYCAVCKETRVFSYTKNHNCIGNYLVTLDVDTYNCQCGSFVPYSSLDMAAKSALYVLLSSQNILDIAPALKMAREKTSLSFKDFKDLDLQPETIEMLEDETVELPRNIYRIALCALLFIKTEVDLLLIKDKYNVQLYSKLKSFLPIDYNEAINYIGEDNITKKLAVSNDFSFNLKNGCNGSKISRLALCNLVIPHLVKNYSISKIENDVIINSEKFKFNRVIH